MLSSLITYTMLSVCTTPVSPVSAFLSQRALMLYYQYQQMFVMLLFVLMVTGFLSGPLGTVQNFFANLIFRLAALPFRLFGAV